MEKLILILLTFISSFATAGEWLYLFNSETEKYSIDLESVKNVNNYNKDLIKAWYKLEAYKSLASVDLRIGDETLILYNFDCKKETMGISQAQKYRNKKPTDQYVNIKVPNMKQVIPDTLGTETLNRACAIHQINNGTRSYMQLNID